MPRLSVYPEALQWLSLLSPLTEIRAWLTAYRSSAAAELAGFTARRRPRMLQPISGGGIAAGCITAGLASFILIGLLLGELALDLTAGNPDVLLSILQTAYLLLLGLVAPVGVLWLLRELFSIARWLLAAFGPRTQLHSGALDELLLASPLSDREIVAGLISGGLRRLAGPLLLSALAGALGSAVALGGEARHAFSPDFGAAMILAILPLFFASFAMTAGLGCLALLASLPVLGRGLRGVVNVSVAAAVVCLGQLLWIGACVLMLLDLSYADRGGTSASALFEDSTLLLNFALAALSLALLVVLVLGLTSAALLRPAIGTLLLYLQPLLALLFCVGPFFAALTLGQAGGDIAANLARLALNNIYALSAVNMVNAMVYPLYPSGLPLSERGFILPMFEWWRLPLMLAAQLVLVQALGRLCLKACRMARRGE